jgi:3-hydroxybutyryl-CoA dehydrogenase
MHFFNPAPVQKFVEVIRADQTLPEVVTQVADLARSLGKHSAVIGDKPGFIVNRLLLAYINHALLMLDSGRADAMHIDIGIREYADFPMGPIELADLIGLDTCLEVLNTIYADTNDSFHRPAESLVAHVAAGNLGRKTGLGYYDYSLGNPELVSTDKDLEDNVADELIGVYEMDARAMRDSGYASQEDIDAGMRLGCNLPHGPFGQ